MSNILNRKVALVTGGASGMGLAVAQKLSRSGWVVAVVDLDRSESAEVLKQLGDTAMFIQADVSNYDSQLAAFQEVKKAMGRIDFVFANAGIIGRGDFYDSIEADAAPAKPSMLVQEVCLTGVIYTAYLAMHFMRKNESKEGMIVMTASAASLYATPDLPLYTSSKHGVLGLMRSLSSKLGKEGIRVNCILPGAIRTALHSQETWQQFDQDDFTPIDEIVAAVLALLKDPEANGRAMEISRGETFDRKQPPFSNDTMRKIMTSSSY